MNKQFDKDEAKKFLLAKEEQEKLKREEERKVVLQKVTSILQDEFKESSVEVYLIGSITQPFRFSARSDVDIVIKNFHEDRFELWAKLEGSIGRKVEVILFEKCQFQEFVLKEGFKVV